MIFATDFGMFEIDIFKPRINHDALKDTNHFFSFQNAIEMSAIETTSMASSNAQIFNPSHVSD